MPHRHRQEISGGEPRDFLILEFRFLIGPGQKPRSCNRKSKIKNPKYLGAQASGLVLRRPVIRSPSFHWPRFLSNSVRSKRLSTFRLPPKVAAARRLRCCDINQIRVKPTLKSSRPGSKRTV